MAEFTVTMPKSRLFRLRGLYDVAVIRAGMDNPDFGALVRQRFAEREYLAGFHRAHLCDYRITREGRDFAKLLFEGRDNVGREDRAPA